MSTLTPSFASSPVLRSTGVRRSSVTPRSTDALRLTMRGRRLLVGVFVVALGALLAFAVSVLGLDAPGAAASGSNSPVSAGPAVESVVLAPGDTLWELATELDPTGDPREVIDTILLLNGIDGPADVVAGMQLLVPILD